MREIKFSYKDPKGHLFVIDLDDLPAIDLLEYHLWEYAGQYTGLYEGDVLEWKIGQESGKLEEFEVLGNVYENPELLSGEWR